MSIRRIISVDAETGEPLEGQAVLIPARQRNGFRGRWMAMAQDALAQIAQFRRVEDFRVLFALLARLDFENLITCNQAAVARELDMSPPQVNRAIRRLIDAGAILDGPRVGTSKTFRLNPNFGWKGSARNHVTALDAERERRLRASGISGVVDGGKTPERDPDTADLFDEPPA